MQRQKNSYSFANTLTNFIKKTKAFGEHKSLRKMVLPSGDNLHVAIWRTERTQAAALS